MESSPPEEQAGAHYRTSGLALVGMGVFGGVLALVLNSSGVTLGFIDARGIVVIAIIFALVGGVMVTLGERGDG